MERPSAGLVGSDASSAAERTHELDEHVSTRAQWIGWRRAPARRPLNAGGAAVGRAGRTILAAPSTSALAHTASRGWAGGDGGDVRRLPGMALVEHAVDHRCAGAGARRAGREHAEPGRSCRAADAAAGPTGARGRT